MKVGKTKKANNCDKYHVENKTIQQQPSFFPLSGVGYMEMRSSYQKEEKT
jgi:hypothetical protein